MSRSLVVDGSSVRLSSAKLKFIFCSWYSSKVRAFYRACRNPASLGHRTNGRWEDQVFAMFKIILVVRQRSPTLSRGSPTDAASKVVQLSRLPDRVPAQEVLRLAHADETRNFAENAESASHSRRFCNSRLDKKDRCRDTFMYEDSVQIKILCFAKK